MSAFISYFDRLHRELRITTYIETEDQLREIYGYAKHRAKDKQLTALEKHSKNFIEH